MTSASRNISFRELKSRVGIDDVAYALGYRLDRKAGVGRYIELVLGDGIGKRDTIIISNPHDKARQTFFRRDGSKGDVVTLIKENIDSFFVTGRTEWEKIAKIMARFANMPIQEQSEYTQSAGISREFDSERYEVKSLNPDHIPNLFRQRGISDRTILRFAPFITLIRDTRNDKFDGYNVGFPYTVGGDGTIQGYEIRGLGGYKSKAAGTNSSTAAWVVDLSQGKGGCVRNLFFCESAFDGMAFYQLNRLRIGDRAAIVSLGGTFSDGQIAETMARFPEARAFDCFDNDIAGRIYGLRLMSIIEGIPMKIRKIDDGLLVEAGGKSFTVNPDRPLYSEVGQHLTLRHRMGQWRPPADFKDWNDCLLDKRIEPKILPSKFDRDENLAGRRSSGLKV